MSKKIIKNLNPLLKKKKNVKFDRSKTRNNPIAETLSSLFDRK